MSQSFTEKPIVKQVLNALKWLWMLIVLAALLAYLFRNFSEIIEQVQVVPISFLLGSFLLACVGRIFFITMSSEILAMLGYPQPFRTVFYLAASSELGKYLPGGVWHLVGRAAYYRALNMPLKLISRSLIQENLWMVLAAGMAGVSFLILAYTGLHASLLMLLIIWYMMLFLWARTVAWWRVLLQVLLQIIVWLLWGLSFALILPIESNFAFSLAMGAFALSWLIGFVTLFAPGGLGVREAALVAFLLPIMPSSEILIFALVHRLLWILVELLFGLIAWIFLDLH